MISSHTTTYDVKIIKTKGAAMFSPFAAQRTCSPSVPRVIAVRQLPSRKALFALASAIEFPDLNVQAVLPSRQASALGVSVSRSTSIPQ